MNTVRKPIVIRSKPLSTYEVAEILGVSKKRTGELIAMAHETGAKSKTNTKHTAKVNGSASIAARRTRTKTTSTPTVGQRALTSGHLVGD